ncbi:glycosyltransferase family 4 protein [Flaviaesturariibacter terrae]
MRPLRISIVLPFPMTKPVGGAKIMYEYANRLQARGHQVQVFHSIRRPFKKMKSPLWWKQLVYAVRGAKRPKWFPLNSGIPSVIVPEISDRYLPDADVVLSTWWQMAYALSALSPAKGEPFQLVQDYETWAGQVDKVHESYRLRTRPLVIARYLQDLLRSEAGVEAVHIPNAIDSGRFRVQTPPAARPAASVIMLYSKEPRKGTSFGLEALEALQRQLPALQVTLFGVFDAPPALPSWITYHKQPGNLVELYNRNAVFFSPSLGEGWALPPAEAMACGCAVVCTGIGGHADYAIDGETALLVPPKDVAAMTAALHTVISNEELRARLSANGERLITTGFSWDASVAKMEQCFYGAVETGAKSLP